jgi:phosphatidylinositol alpha-1,6-mannosyltransferase
VVTLAPGGVEGRSLGPAREEPAVVRVHNVPRGGRRSILRVNARAIVEGARHRPDVIVVLHVKLAPAAVLLARRFRVPIAQYVHAKEMLEVPELARLAVRSACAVIAVSSYSKMLAEEAGAHEERIRVIHNGVDLPAKRMGPQSSMPTLITVSRLEDRYKGHDVFLKALPMVRERIPNVQWLVVGEGILRAELEQDAVRLGVGDCVKFLGSVSDTERDALLDSAWAFVMLSRQPSGRRAGEGFGIVYVEAGAHGLPVIAGRVPGVIDAVQEGATGILIDPTKVGEAASAATSLLTDDALRRRLGKGGMTRARELQWSAIVPQVQAVLDECQGSRYSPPSLTHTNRRWPLELLLGAGSDRDAQKVEGRSGW